jgi:hypothetical protein
MTRLPDGPLATFALFAYNQEQFIREAVEAALAQDYSPLELILSDDHSSDRTFSIMAEIVAGYRGPHTIVLNQNPTNLGLTGHVNRLMYLARGELIVAAAGDDVSLPHRTRVMMRAWTESGKRLGSLFSSYELIDAHGSHLKWVRLDAQRWIADSEQRIKARVLEVGASHCWSSALFRRYGDIGFDAVNEDAVIQFRASLVDGVDIISEPLVKYRVHKTNISNLSSATMDGEDHELRVTRIGHSRFLKCLQNYQKDLQTEQSFGADSDRVAGLLRLVATRIRLWELRLRYLVGNRTERLRVIRESAKLGGEGRLESTRMFFHFLFPRAYRIARSHRGIRSAWHRAIFRQRA